MTAFAWGGVLACHCGFRAGVSVLLGKTCPLDSGHCRLKGRSTRFMGKHSITYLVLFSILLVSCGGLPQPAAPLFPETVGAWKLKQSTDLAADQVPEPIRRLGIRRAGSAVYEGPGRLKVEVYELTSSAAAFEAEQTWRPMADTVVFHKESLFTVVHWENADRAEVSAFVREMAKRAGG